MKEGPPKSDSQVTPTDPLREESGFSRTRDDDEITRAFLAARVENSTYRFGTWKCSSCSHPFKAESLSEALGLFRTHLEKHRSCRAFDTTLINTAREHT